MKKKEITIGLCVIIAMTVLVVGINYLKGINMFKTANYYYAEYTNVAGLQQSAPVTVNGFKVGLVRELNYEYDNPGHIRVELSLNKNLRVPRGTKAVIEQDLLGTASIVLHMGEGQDFHDVGNTLIGETASGLMEGLSDNLMPNINAIFPKIDSLLTNINALVADPALAASVKRLDSVTRNLELTMAQLTRAAQPLPGVIGNVDAITADFHTVSADLAEVSAQLRQAPIDSTLQNLYTLSENLKTLSQELNNPDSSLGRLTHDDALYENLNSCAASLDSLLVDVKRNPKRYISIKLL